MDVHQATISVAVMDAHRKLIMERLMETKAGTIVEFIQGPLIGEKSPFHSLASCLRSFEGDGRGGGPPCLELGISDITSVISALRGVEYRWKANRELCV
jgi:hypothetical protein